jgi:hypothetical protein
MAVGNRLIKGFAFLWALFSREIAAAAHPQGFAQRRHAVLFNVFLHECVPHPFGLLTKYTCAFFRISLTSRRCATSFSNCAIRFCSALNSRWAPA